MFIASAPGLPVVSTQCAMDCGPHNCAANAGVGEKRGALFLHGSSRI